MIKFSLFLYFFLCQLLKNKVFCFEETKLLHFFSADKQFNSKVRRKQPN